MKICSKCKIEKDLSNFCKSKNRKSGYEYHCKECKKIWSSKEKLLEISNKKYKVYCIKINDYYYIGSTDTSLEYRMSIHIDCAKRIRKHNTYIYKYIKDNNFVTRDLMKQVSILIECESREQMLELEKIAIRRYVLIYDEKCLNIKDRKFNYVKVEV